MASTEEIERAWWEFDRASAQLTKAKVGDNKAEGKYGQAYQTLVMLGVVPQIRLKYRRVTG